MSIGLFFLTSALGIVTRKGRDYRLGERSEYSPTHAVGNAPKSKHCALNSRFLFPKDFFI